MLNLIFGLLISILTGFFTISLIENRLNNSIKILLSIPLGFGITSIIYYAWLLMGGQNFLFYRVLELVLASVLGLFTLKKNKITSQQNFRLHFEKRYLFFYIMNLVGLLLFAYCTSYEPFGSWDGWRIWNTKAEFLYKSGPYWRNLFLLPTALSHTDYPLFLSSSVARLWKYAGYESILSPITIGILFTFSIPALILNASKMLEKTNTGIILASLLLASQLFIINGAFQNADIPLSMFILSSVVLLVISYKIKSDKTLLLSALLCAFSGWVKNEGLIFMSVFLICTALFSAYKKEYKKLLYIAIPILFGFFLLYIFKSGIGASNNDYIEGIKTVGIGANLFVISRYTSVLKYLILFITSNPVFYGFLLLLFLSNKDFSEKIPKDAETPGYIALLICTLMIISYLFIYVLTPNNIEWQLRTSFDRVFLQIWPTLIFVFIAIFNNNSKLTNQL